MLFKLLVSAALTVSCVLAIQASLGDVPGTTRMFLFAIVALVAGNHRNIVPAGDAIDWLKVHAPQGERVRVIESMWGVPMSRGRQLRVSSRARAVTTDTPTMSRFAELWPTPIRAVMRKLLVRRNGR